MPEFVRVRVSVRVRVNVRVCLFVQVSPVPHGEEPENETYVLYFSLRTRRGVNRSDKMKYR